MIATGFGLLEFVSEALSPSSGGTAGAIAWAYLAISVHNSILNGSENQFFRWKGVFPSFFWRSLVLALPGIILSVVALAMLDIGKNRIFLTMIPIYGLVTAVVLSVAGTWLPAVVAENGDRSLASAFRRGRFVFGYTLIRLIMGFGTGAMVAFVVTFALITLGVATGWGEARVGPIEPFIIATMIVFTILFAFPMVMLPVILSRAYIVAENKAKAQ